MHDGVFAWRYPAKARTAISQSGQTCALLSKVFPTRSHTVSAQGGITVALGNTHEDNWELAHVRHKGSDYIGDQDAIEYMCKTGPEAILELEHMGLPFSRLDDGRIYQRPRLAVSRKTSAASRRHVLRRQLTVAGSRTVAHALSAEPENHTTIFLRVVCAGFRKTRWRSGRLYRTVHRNW